MTMPDMTGIELSTRLKKINSEIPVILCTGFSKGISDEKVEAMGIDGFIMKPIVRDELATLIREVLDHHNVNMPGA